MPHASASRPCTLDLETSAGGGLHEAAANQPLSRTRLHHMRRGRANEVVAVALRRCLTLASPGSRPVRGGGAKRGIVRGCRASSNSPSGGLVGFAGALVALLGSPSGALKRFRLTRFGITLYRFRILKPFSPQCKGLSCCFCLKPVRSSWIFLGAPLARGSAWRV